MFSFSTKSGEREGCVVVLTVSETLMKCSRASLEEREREKQKRGELALSEGRVSCASQRVRGEGKNVRGGASAYKSKANDD